MTTNSSINSPGFDFTNHGIMVAQGTAATVTKVLTNGQLLIGSTGADPVAASISAGTGISVTPGAGTITISATGAEVWVDQASSPVTMAVNTGYVADLGTLLTFNVPATAAVGDTFIIQGKGAGGWTVVANTGQTIHLGSSATSVAGSLASTNQWDSVTITCVTANTAFACRAVQGNITVA